MEFIGRCTTEKNLFVYKISLSRANTDQIRLFHQKKKKDVCNTDRIHSDGICSEIIIKKLFIYI